MTYNLLNGAEFRPHKASSKVAEQHSETDGANTTYGIRFNPSNDARDNAHPNSDSVGYYCQVSKALSFTKDADCASDDPLIVDGKRANGRAGYRHNGDRATERGKDTTRPVSDFDDATRVYGLDQGYSLLVEHETPARFNELAHPMVVYVKGDLAATTPRSTTTARPRARPIIPIMIQMIRARPRRSIWPPTRAN